MKFILSFFILFTFLLQAQIKDVTLLLPWKHQFQFAGYYMAEELGLYEKEGLHVKIKERDLKVNYVKEVATSNVAFGVGYSSLLVSRINKYPQIKLLFAINQSSPFILLAKKRDDLKTLSDIINKTVMLDLSDVTSASINAMLFSQGVTKENFKFAPVSFDTMNLIDNSVDLKVAYLSNEPFALAEKGIETTIFNPKNYGYDFYSDILFTSDKFITDNPDKTKAFIKASLQGWRYAYENIDETVNIILKKYNTQSKSRKALLYEAKILKELAIKDGVKLGNLNTQKLNETINTFRFLGFIPPDTHAHSEAFIYNVIIDEEDKLYKAEQEEVLLKSLYAKYKIDIVFMICTLTLIFMLFFYLRYQGKKTLKQNYKDLEKNYAIFNKYILSSKTDLKGVITYVSDAYCDFSGYTKEELVGNTFKLIRDPTTPSSVYKDLWMTISSGHIYEGVTQNIKKDGSKYKVKIIISPIFDSNENIIAYEDIKLEI